MDVFKQHTIDYVVEHFKALADDPATSVEQVGEELAEITNLLCRQRNTADSVSCFDIVFDDLSVAVEKGELRLTLVYCLSGPRYTFAEKLNSIGSMVDTFSIGLQIMPRLPYGPTSTEDSVDCAVGFRLDKWPGVRHEAVARLLEEMETANEAYHSDIKAKLDPILQYYYQGLTYDGIVALCDLGASPSTPTAYFECYLKDGNAMLPEVSVPVDVHP